ncbi:MAG: replicative DNA helicase [Planctomycetes bacterium]|nr:replicative DNA helicase [Planctomycetota bacterium]
MNPNPPHELPHDLQAERSVLGAILLDSDRVTDAIELLRETDFYEPRHRHIFAAMRRLHDGARAIDLVTLRSELEARGEFEAIGGHLYVFELMQSVTTSAHLTHHAELVTSAARIRDCVRAADQLREDALGARRTAEDVDALLTQGMDRLAAIGQGLTRGGPVIVSDGLEELLDRLCNPFTAASCEFGSGFVELDELTGGFKRGDLIVLAARPSMGKTAFALNVADHIALPVESDRRPTVLVFSLEMSREQLVSRLVCARADVSARAEGGGPRSEHERAALYEAGGTLAGANLWIDDASALSTRAIRNRALRVRQKHKLDLIVVDYLQLITAPSGAESRQVAISQVSGELKSLARELDVPVIAVSQLSRKVEERNPPRPMLSDLRESGAIEQDADVVILLYRENYYQHLRKPENDGKTEVIVAKHRNGPTGSVLVHFDPTRARFRSSTVIESVPFDADHVR